MCARLPGLQNLRFAIKALEAMVEDEGIEPSNIPCKSIGLPLT